MLTEDQKAEICREIAECPAYLGKLDSYEKQALAHYVAAKRAELVRLPADVQAYYRLVFPAYAFADVVAALLAAEVVEATPEAKATPQKPAREVSRTRPAILRPGLTVEAIRAVFAPLQITQAGEWAAALAALVAGGALQGDASKVHRWLEASIGANLTSRKTVADRMEYAEAKQFHNLSERHIFKEVLKVG